MDDILGWIIILGFIVLMIIVVVGIIVGLGYLFGLGWQMAEGYEYKNMTISISKNSLFYCYLPNPDKGSVICDSVDMKKRQWNEFDDFIEAFVNDRVERSYKVEIP